MNQETSSQRQLALNIAESSAPKERVELQFWIKELLDIRGSNTTSLQKARRAVSITANRKVLLPMIKTISRAIKLHGWDKQKTSMRYGIVGAGAGLALFGSASAGIAALGGAIGVPLWIVLGAGASSARILYGELSAASNMPTRPKSTYTIIDAEKEDS